ncbi:1-(5-phosphoribosyl)-5-amino-4-imidazole-carboxylate carboxylase [Phytophthora megakarya]|uniref:phosphoribosylaminoimidazole carboxylase n=1 Tax=Phytophthora megakarya TaxID=4795 RepID=A0A225X4L3_9STRA|nr:1-(5-phosphoribosyl)-5-amino-4-imidazole-carboxylate carboxylase [Phytophthora megakarya]
MNLVGVLRSRHARRFMAVASGRGVATQFQAAGFTSSSNSEDSNSILELLQRVADGKVSPQSAAELCAAAAEYEAVGNFAKIDTKREFRTGFPEVVYAESKTPEQVAAIMNAMIDGGENNVMASRVTQQAADEIRALMPHQHLTYYEVPRILASKTLDNPIKREPTKSDNAKKEASACVLCAGTSDLPVAEEAAVTLELADFRVTRLYDVGVAGIHRLLRNQHVLRASDVAICVAGMDGALPGVVGGLTSSPVIAVPTSVGYGAAFGGLAPLLTMLNACSPGVGVVNIDNGFGAAVLAASRNRRYVAPTSTSSLSGELSPSSLHGSAAIKQEPTAMDTESSSDSQLPSPAFRSLQRTLPIGGESRERQQKNRRKRRSSGDDAVVREEAESSEEEKQEQVEMLTISVEELERRLTVVADEQLKRIAEFGRVHGTIMQEAKEYVGNMEMQMRNQLEHERTVLRAEAEEFVAETTKENEALRQKVKDLTLQVEGLEKQVDTLEQENDATKKAKASSTQHEETQQGNGEQPQQTHSPPNNQTQVLPENGKTNRTVETISANNSHKANGSEPGGRKSLHPPLVIKQVSTCSASIPTNPTPQHEGNESKDQLVQQQQPPTPPNGTQPKARVVAQDGLSTTKSSQPPAPSGPEGAGEINTSGGTT